METFIDKLAFLGTCLSVLADVLGVAFGCLALWGLVFKRKQLAQLFRILSTAHFGQRVNRCKESLGRLDALNFDNKNNRAEIHALIGQLCGCLSTLKDENPALITCHAELLQIVERKVKMSEARKCRICSELHTHLDKITLHSGTP